VHAQFRHYVIAMALHCVRAHMYHLGDLCRRLAARIGEGEDEHPLVVVWEFGAGRAMAFSTDCSPHWAAFFQPWEYYGQFWRQAVRWLAKES